MIKTSGTAFKKIQRSLKEANARFKLLGKKAQRVAIARDVIAQIKAEKYIAESTYFRWVGGGPSTEDSEVQNMELAECISQTKCQVCGIGSLFASAVRKHDKLKVSDFDLNWDLRRDEVDYLTTWFSEEQLNLIEGYYEKNLGNYEEDVSPILRKAKDNDRLIMIMENIISNEGTFNPRKGKHSHPKAARTGDAMRVPSILVRVSTATPRLLAPEMK